MGGDIETIGYELIIVEAQSWVDDVHVTMLFTFETLYQYCLANKYYHFQNCCFMYSFFVSDVT